MRQAIAYIQLRKLVLTALCKNPGTCKKHRYYKYIKFYTHQYN
jgi:hypothetical protein